MFVNLCSNKKIIKYFSVEIKNTTIKNALRNIFDSQVPKLIKKYVNPVDNKPLSDLYTGKIRKYPLYLTYDHRLSAFRLCENPQQFFLLQRSEGGFELHVCSRSFFGVLQVYGGLRAPSTPTFRC